jgi:hypothetical protein
LANKEYTSIIRLFNHCDISINDDFNLSRARKQLQAEFGIAQDGFIEIEGYTYTRHDVFEELERPDFLNRLTFHKQIWDSPQILELLEKSSIDLSTIDEEFSPFFLNREFDNFFSPYFAGPFFYLSRTLLAGPDLSRMGHLLKYEDFLQPADREEAFRSIRIFLDENLRTLRNVNEDNYKMMRPKIVHWIDSNWPVFYNNLPHEFYEIKNDIITRLVNIGVAVQKSHRRDCKEMSSRLIRLTEVPDNLGGLIISNHKAYMGSSSSSTVSWRGGLFICWIIIMILRGAFSDGCNNSTSTSRPYIQPEMKYELPEPTKLDLKDTLNRTRFSYQPK